MTPADALQASGRPARANLDGTVPSLDLHRARPARTLAADALSLLALVLSIPFIVIGLGLPLVVVIRLFLWVIHRF